MAFLFPAATSATSLSALTSGIAPVITPSPIFLQRRDPFDDFYDRCISISHNNTCAQQRQTQWSDSCHILYSEIGDYETNSELRSCGCSLATSWMNCYSSLMISEGCEQPLFYTDWNSVKSDALSFSTCDIPTSLQSATSSSESSGSGIYIELQTVHVVTVTRTDNASITTAPPLATSSSSVSDAENTHTYVESGDIMLSSYCAIPTYSQVQDGNSVLWMAVVGCKNDRPGCCAWNMPGYYGNDLTTRVVIDVASPTPTSSASASTTSATASALAFPTVPSTVKKDILDACPKYFSRFHRSICCPVGFEPFSRAIGGNTPCWSTPLIHGWSTPPALLVTADASVSATLTPFKGSTLTIGQVPTSAIGYYIFTRSYEAKADGLSGGAIAGIVVGCVVGVVIIVGGLVFFFLRRRRTAKREQLPQHDQEQEGSELNHWTQNPPQPYDPPSMPSSYMRNKQMPMDSEGRSSSDERTLNGGEHNRNDGNNRNDRNNNSTTGQTTTLLNNS